MANTEQIRSFKEWAIEIGCPSKILPSDDGLESFFKSKQHELFKNVVNQVRPIKLVQEAKKNIILSQIENIENQETSLNKYSHLSNTVKRYLKVKHLKEVREDVTAKLEAQRHELTKITARINIKNTNDTNKNARKDNIRATVSIYSIKLKQLEQQLWKEEENKKQILSTMPAKLIEKNGCEEYVLELVNQALMVLQKYTSSTEQCKTVDDVKTAKNHMWEQLRTILTKLPNANLFKVIMFLKEKQMIDLESLMRADMDNSATNISKNKPIVLSVVDINLLKAKASKLGHAAKYLTAKKEYIEIKDWFAANYIDLVTMQKNRLLPSNTSSQSDEFDERLFEFIFQCNLRNMKKRENELLIQEINYMKTEKYTNMKRLEDHEYLLCAVKQHYSEINVAINRLQYDTKQLRQIREKILKPKYLFKNISKRRLIGGNETLSLATECFEMKEKSVFSSSKLDFEASKSDSLQLTHATELIVFTNTSIKNLRFMPQMCAAYLLPNHLTVEPHEHSTLDNFDAGLLLNSKKFLEQYKKGTKATKLLALEVLALHFDKIRVDLKHIMETRNSQREHLAEFLDKIKSIICALNDLLVNTDLLYNFVVNNPLKKFVGCGKHSMKYTLNEYETEFLTYLRMLENRLLVL